MIAGLFWVALLAPQVDPWVDGSLTVGATLGWGILHLKAPQWTATQCPCTPNQVNRFDRIAVHTHHPTAEAWADALATGTLALSLAAPIFLSEEAATDTLLVAEASAVTGLLTGLAKLALARPYPYMYGPAPYPEQNSDGVNYASFWSGHTAVPMAGAVAAAELFALRNPHSPWRWVWRAAGPVLALSAGALQVAANNHFPSDVLVGAAIGGSVGWLVPWLHE